MNLEIKDISFELLSDERKLVVAVEGVMHYKQRKHFLSQLNALDQDINICEVDFTKTTFIDSSSIGLLIILKDNPHLKKAEFIVKTENNMTISKLLKSQCLDQIFKIA